MGTNMVGTFMKVCQKCGHVDYNPENKCPKCTRKYKQPSSCNPLSGHRDDRGIHNVNSPAEGDGNYHFESTGKEI